ncbi:MAG: LLM class F420-dependent oxidoreductase [Pseudonocardiaceae bacterium]|nr:LLM class F420-dependent oxidoreductase [Pseudonocardiaceae bacterium]
MGGNVGTGRLGMWDTPFGWDRLRDPAALAELEELGVSTLWVGSSPNGDLRLIEELLAASTTLTVATGIVNVWEATPEVTAASYHRVLAKYPDRLVLGIGAGHRAISGERYTRPYEKLVSYLDGLDAGRVPVEGRMLAALGPKVLRLARDRTAGAHPYLATPEHTAQAREVLGAGKLLVPEQKVVLMTDPARARALARQKLEMYLGLPNYTNNWLRLGFTEDDLRDGGSDRLVDALVVWGDEDAVRARVEAHREAGADQVALQVLNDDKLAVLRTLAPVLT